MPRYETHQIAWRDYLIEVRHCPSYSPSFEDIYGHGMSHTEIETIEPARAPLPITETGYRSHFAPTPEITAAGGAVAFVLEALEQAAADPNWKAKELAARQMELF